MVTIGTALTANQVLAAFHHDALNLFMGASFATVGIVSIAFCVLRRRFDSLLVWMALFAGLYGLRMWMNATIVDLALGPGLVFLRLRSAVDFLVPIPAFGFFREAGFLGRGARLITLSSQFAFPAMFLIALLAGPSPALYTLNGIIVTYALWIMLARSLGRHEPDREFAVVRIGVVGFAAFALWDNVVARYWLPVHIEPFGFAILLAALGYVSARRIVERDTTLGEIQKELELARRIQLSILPGAFPESEDFRVAARYVPMSSVAGDLYDFLLTEDRHAGLLIADVSGHGVPAALIASMVKMAANAQRGHAADPAKLLAGMNSALCGNTQGQFVTAAYTFLDATKRQLHYAAAGHPAMLMLRNGVVTEIAENGLLLAASELASYQSKTLGLEPGDRLLLYTDGLVEARDREGTLFGEQALMEELLATAGLTADQAADKLIRTAQKWAALQDDDLTVLVCDFAASD